MYALFLKILTKSTYIVYFYTVDSENNEVGFSKILGIANKFEWPVFFLI